MAKYRHELKFLCSEPELNCLEQKIKQICKKDAYAAKKEGIYRIRSVYFDTLEDEFLQDNIDGVDDRFKYRIRIYNESDEIIKLEKKGTHHGLKIKESCSITREQCGGILRGERVAADPTRQRLLEEFQAQRSYLLLRPKVTVEYTRTPYVYAAGNVRVTFDRNIYSSPDVTLFSKEISRRPVLPEGMELLEVKYDEYLPGAISELLSSGKVLERTSFSKYAMCRVKNIR